MKKRAASYARVSTGDQHLETQLLDLREMAKQRGNEIVHQYTDVISGAKSKRPGLDQLMTDARRHRFYVVFVVAFDRIARNVRHFLDVLDELNQLGIEFVVPTSPDGADGFTHGMQIRTRYAGGQRHRRNDTIGIVSALRSTD